jgi:hypothetical protein
MAFLMAWLARLIIPAVLWLLKVTFRWVMSPDHASKARENFRVFWWKWHERAAATPGKYDDATADAVGIFFAFTHSPDEKALITAQAAMADPRKPTGEPVVKVDPTDVVMKP